MLSFKGIDGEMIAHLIAEYGTEGLSCTGKTGFPGKLDDGGDRC